MPLDKPHRANLRKGRMSLPDQAYFVTKCVDRSLGNALALPRCADILIASLLWARDQGWWRILGFCIMPDHYHPIVGLRSPRTLDSVLASVDKFAARRINEELGRRGPFWEDGYYDHLIRDRSDFDDILAYVHNNPVKAELVTEIDQWEHSTASRYASEIDWEWIGPSMPAVVRSDYRFDAEMLPPRYR